MTINFKVVALARLGFKPESTAPEVDALTTRPSELDLCNDYYVVCNILQRGFFKKLSWRGH